MQNMASVPFFLNNVITYYVCIVFLVSFIPISFSQIAGNSPPVLPTVSDCGPMLLPLAPCAPFVQGAVPFPVQQCCDNVKQLYQQQPACICLLLNGSTLRSFPINSTRALELPGLCSLQIDITTCGVSQQVPPSSRSSPLPPSPPPSQVSFGTNSSSAVSATPMASVLPRPSIMGFGYTPSTGLKLNADTYREAFLLVSAIVLQFAKLF